MLHIREEERIIAIIDRVAKSKGSDRSSIIREGIRFYLASNSHLTEQEQIDVGVLRTILRTDPTKHVEANRNP